MTCVISVRVSPQTKEKLESLARAKNTTISELARKVLESYAEVAEIVDIAEILKRKDSQIIDNFVLKLQLSSRYEGCGWVYLWRESIKILIGKAEIIELEIDDNPDECLREAKIAVVPKSVPVVLAKCYEDEDPGVSNSLDLYVFDGKHWRKERIWLGDKSCPFTYADYEA